MSFAKLLMGTIVMGGVLGAGLNALVPKPQSVQIAASTAAKPSAPAEDDETVRLAKITPEPTPQERIADACHADLRAAQVGYAASGIASRCGCIASKAVEGVPSHHRGTLATALTGEVGRLMREAGLRRDYADLPSHWSDERGERSLDRIRQAFAEIEKHRREQERLALEFSFMTALEMRREVDRMRERITACDVTASIHPGE